MRNDLISKPSGEKKCYWEQLGHKHRIRSEMPLPGIIFKGICCQTIYDGLDKEITLLNYLKGVFPGRVKLGSIY